MGDRTLMKDSRLAMERIFLLTRTLSDNLPDVVVVI